MKKYAVIVAYNPDEKKLLRLCMELSAHGIYTVIVDNTIIPYLNKTLFHLNCEIVELNFNFGIAYAQNIGVRIALEANAEGIFFFDQDSTVLPGFLGEMINALKVGTPHVISPLSIDDIDNTELPAIILNNLGIPRPVFSQNRKTPYNVDVVISSGTAITSEVFEIVGLFDEDLFIDFVDTEWCLRCRSKKIPIQVIPSAKMKHRIGNKTIRLGPFLLAEHSAIRCYYQIRNSLNLLRKKEIPLLFATKEIISLCFNRTLLLFFIKNPLHYMKFYFFGLRDGMLGVKGPFSSN